MQELPWPNPDPCFKAKAVAHGLTASAQSYRLAWATRKTVSEKAAYNSIQNANVHLSTKRLVRITHPFHPCRGRKFPCVGERYSRYGRRLLLQIDESMVCSVPPQWTDLVAPDLEIIMGKRRALFRLADLMELAGLVERLGRGNLPETRHEA